MWAFDDNGDNYDDLMVAAPGEVCNASMTGGYHQFRGHPDGIVDNKLLNNPVDLLECMGWTSFSFLSASGAYARCMEFADPDCGPALTSDFESMSQTPEAKHVAACEVGIEFALDACEHWISDPVCDVDLCITSALELSNIADGCHNEGDVLTHGD